MEGNTTTAATSPMTRVASARVKSSPDGLTQAETRRRLTHYGYKELPKEKRNPLLESTPHFWGSIPWMIEAAAMLSALFKHSANFVIILVLLLARKDPAILNPPTA